MSDAPSKWQSLWKQHGTKIIGAFSTVAGMLLLLDHETIDLMASLFGPVWKPRITRALLILIGLGTAWRGFTNSRNLKS